MPDEPQISFGQALEGFQGQISVKVNGCHCSKYCTHLKFLLWAMPDESQISFGQALEGFQGQIILKVNVCYVTQNIVCVLNFFFLSYA